jgi:hypothetical protein
MSDFLSTKHESGRFRTAEPLTMQNSRRYPNLPHLKLSGANPSGWTRGIDRHIAMGRADQTDRAARMLHKSNSRFGLPRFASDAFGQIWPWSSCSITLMTGR